MMAVVKDGYVTVIKERGERNIANESVFFFRLAKELNRYDKTKNFKRVKNDSCHFSCVDEKRGETVVSEHEMYEYELFNDDGITTLKIETKE